jgi:hypothetical protein
MGRKRRLGQILVEAGMIDDFQLRSALSDQKRWGRPLGVTLLKLGFMEEDELVRVLSRQLDVPIVDLQGKRIAPAALSALSIQIAEKARCIPLFQRDDGGRTVLYLGMEDPTDLSVLDDLAFRTGMEIRPVLVGPNQLTDAIERHYNALEWDGEDEDEPEVGMAAEPGDTAPMVFKPDEVAPETTLGPEVLEPAPAPAEAPPGEAEFTLEAPAPEPPPAEPELVDFSQDDFGPLDTGEVSPPSRDLGPEFITDGPVAPPPTQAPPEPEPMPSAREEPAPPVDAPRERPSEVPSRTILRAVTKLLVEKGIFERHELVAVIRELQELDPEA